MSLLSEYYTLIKTIHVSSVGVSGLFFFIRGLWMIQAPSLLERRWVRISPHVIDTLLLVSAVLLMLILNEYPVQHDWLTAKIMALLAYIGFGMVAIRHGRDRRVRITAWLIALAIFCYILGVALTRSTLL
jgi:uncharacterized membrane protein SirB2